MTREEALEYLYIIKQDEKDWDNTERVEAIDMAIKALEQEPSCDMVSRGVFEQVMWERDVAIKQLKELGYGFGEKPKTGHWIEGQTDNPNIHNILCSCCFEGYPSKGHANSQYTREKYKYCPNCGAKMVEPQESEG